jgi:hypothetical protein
MKLPKKKRRRKPAPPDVHAARREAHARRMHAKYSAALAQAQKLEKQWLKKVIYYNRKHLAADPHWKPPVLPKERASELADLRHHAKGLAEMNGHTLGPFKAYETWYGVVRRACCVRCTRLVAIRAYLPPDDPLRIQGQAITKVCDTVPFSGHQ